MQISIYRAFNRFSAMPNLHLRQSVSIVCKTSIAIVAFFVASTASAEPYDAKLGPKIDTYLEGKGSPIAGNGPVFFSSGMQWDVDPRLIVSIAGAESSFGTQWVNCPASGFNAWSWFYTVGKPCSASPFTSFAQGIMTVTKFIRLRYLDNDQTTIQAIQSRPGHQYCFSGCGSWVANVTNFYTAQGGNTADLTFHIGLIDFEQFQSEPSKIGSVQPPRKVFARINGTVSKKNADSATISGGSLLSNFRTADQTVVYGTASSPFCTGCLPRITIQFAQKVSNFSVYLINGLPQRPRGSPVTYIVKDDQGGMQTITLGSNWDFNAAQGGTQTNSDSGTVMLPDTGIRQVTVAPSDGGGNFWYFAIGNIRFSPD